MSSTALVAVVVLPIIAAALPPALGLRYRDVGWWVGAAVAPLHLAASLAVLLGVLDAGRVRHELGGHAPPFGIELVADGLSAPVLVLISVAAIGFLAASRRTGPRSNAVHSVVLLLIGGLSGIVATGDLFNLYVFLEITGLAAYTLVASADRPRAAYAAFKYLIVGTVGATLYLLGVGYAYVATGTLNMADLAVRLADAGYGATPVVASFLLIAAGLAVKTGLYPLHVWQPDAYDEAPTTVSALLAALASTAAAYALARVVFAVYTPAFFDAVPLVRRFVVVGAAVSVVAGSALAMTQNRIQRMLAYSSVAQFGIVVIAWGLATPSAVTGGAIHLVGHGVMKGGLFVAAAVVAAEAGFTTVDDYRGAARRSPVGAAAFAVLGLAMVGVPPSVGFVGKLYVLIGAVEAGSAVAVVAIAGSTLLTLAYFGRLLERMYFTEPTTEPVDGEASLGLRTTAVVAAVGAVALGVGAGWLVGAVDAAALLGVGA